MEELGFLDMMLRADWHLGQVFVAIIAGLVTIIVGFTTYSWRQMQKRNFAQSEQYQNNTYVFNLCKALSDPSPRLQMAAAALLFKLVEGATEDGERNAVIQALIASTIDDRTDSSQRTASSEFCKYVADSIQSTISSTHRSKTLRAPMSDFYWQRARIPGAYWAGVDLSGADMFGATLDGASLRRANLRNTIFYGASLVGCKMQGADLTGADLRAANLCGARLDDQPQDDKGPARKTTVINARFEGAIYNSYTSFPEGFNATFHGMIAETAEQTVPSAA